MLELMLGLMLAGCQPATAPSEPDASPSRTSGTVEVQPTCETNDPDAPCVFEPSEVTIRPGQTVRWVNADATFHTVTSSDSLEVRVPNGVFDAVLDEAGETFSRRFPQAGTFPYYCQPHSEFMAGTVQVVEP